MNIRKTIAPILVVCVGNILNRDDGIGAFLLNYLKKKIRDNNFEFIDGGTLGFGLSEYLKNRKKVIIIDAVISGEKCGNVYLFKMKEFLLKKKENLSSHQLHIFDVIKLNYFLEEKLPEIKIIAIEVFDISVGDAISETLLENIDHVQSKVLKIINEEK